MYDKNMVALYRTTSSPIFSGIIVIILIIITLIAGFSIYKKLENTKLELDSCRSSCS